MSDNNKDLYYLEELPDYKVASDDPDVRGWDVVDADNRTIGKVTNLLVSKKYERVIYLDVEVDRSLLEACHDTHQPPPSGEGVHGVMDKNGEDHLIVPVGMVSLDEERSKVLTGQIGFTTFARARRFHEGAAIEREYELLLLRLYTGDDTIDSSTLYEKFYTRKGA